jgi:AraC-like DNA-binding protein
MAEKQTIIGGGNESVSAEYFIALQEFAWERGMSPQAFMQDTGLPMSILIQPQAQISGIAMERAATNVMQHFNDPLIAIEYGMRLSINSHGALGLASQSSENLFAVVELMRNFIQIRSSRIQEVDFCVEGDRAYFTLISDEDKRPSFQFFITSLIMTCETSLRAVTNTQNTFLASEVNFSFDGPSEFPEHFLPPGMSITYNESFNRFSVPVSVMEQPLSRYNPELVTMAKALCEEELEKLGGNDNIITIVRSILRRESGKLPTLEMVAEQLHMSTRTVKRKLSDARTSYQQIKDSERLRKAIHLLEFTDNTIEHVAEQLGYSDASSFNKAFKAWTEVTPAEYRATHTH